MLAVGIIIAVLAPQTVSNQRWLLAMAFGAVLAVVGTFLGLGGSTAYGRDLQTNWLVSIVGLLVLLSVLGRWLLLRFFRTGPLSMQRKVMILMGGALGLLVAFLSR